MTNVPLLRHQPLVSIITVVFNDADKLEETVSSIINLQYPNIEFIVIDGGSTDGTTEIIKKYQNRIQRWVSERDQGIYDAMNKGVRMATGEWINFMNSGDRFASPHSLDFFIDPISSDVDIIYGDAIINYHTFKTTLKTAPLKEMWKRMPFCHQAAFVRSPLMKGNPFNLTYKLSSDYDFFYTALMRNCRFEYIPKIICDFDYTRGASVQNSLRSVKERKIIVLKWGFNLQKWTYYFLHIRYVHLSNFIKRLTGKQFTEWIIRLLKK